MAGKIDQFAKWERIRGKGALHFVLVRGALAWGLGTALTYSLVMWAATGADLRVLLPLSLAIFPIGGLFWGAAMWWFIERRYRRRLQATGT